MYDPGMIILMKRDLKPFERFIGQHFNIQIQPLGISTVLDTKPSSDIEWENDCIEKLSLIMYHSRFEIYIK